MSNFKQIISAALIASTAVFAFAPPAASSALVAWRVSGVAADDLLMVRAYPSSKSKVLAGFENGVRLSMTGKCTGGMRLDEFGGMSKAEQRQAVRYQWCQAWFDHDGDGEYRTGWVYGRYITPN